MEALAIVGLGGEPIGDAVRAVFGPQGGYHLDLGVRVLSPESDVALLVDVFRSADGVRAGGTVGPVYITLTDWDEVEGEGWAVTRAYLDIPCEVDGDPLHAVVTTCDLFDAKVCASIEGEFIAEIPPGNC